MASEEQNSAAGNPAAFHDIHAEILPSRGNSAFPEFFLRLLSASGPGFPDYCPVTMNNMDCAWRRNKAAVQQENNE